MYIFTNNNIQNCKKTNWQRKPDTDILFRSSPRSIHTTAVFWYNAAGPSSKWYKPHHGKGTFGAYLSLHWKLRSACASTDQGFHCLLMVSLHTVKYTDVLSKCPYLYCLHMSRRSFSHDHSHIWHMLRIESLSHRWAIREEWPEYLRRLIYLSILCSLNPSLADHDMCCLSKQCRSRSVGFWRSQLIWTCTVCHQVCEFISIIWIK